MDSRHSERQIERPVKHLERSHGGGPQVGSREFAKQFERAYGGARDGTLERQRDVPLDRPRDVRMPERQAVSGQPSGGPLIERPHRVRQERMQERSEKSLQDRSLERSHEGLRTPHERRMGREAPPVPSLQGPSPSPHAPVSSTSAPQGKIISTQITIPKQQTHTQQIHHPGQQQQQQQLQQQQVRDSYNQQHQTNQPLHNRNLSSPSAIPMFDVQYPQQQQPFGQQPRAPPVEKPQPSRAPPSSRPMSAPSSGQPMNTPYNPPPPSHLGSTPQIPRQPSLPPQAAAVHVPPPVQSQSTAAPDSSKSKPTSINSLLNPAKEELPSRPQSRSTPHHIPPQTRPQTPQQQPPPQHTPIQHASSQLVPAAQHVTQHPPQHRSQPPHHSHHGSLQHLQHASHSHHPHPMHHHHQQHSQSSSIHVPIPGESSRRDVTYDLQHESHQQRPSMAKSSLSRGGPPPYDSVQPSREPSSFSTPPREPYLQPRESLYTPALRETPYSTPPPHSQSQQGLSGSHTPTSHSTLQPSNYAQGQHSHYPPRPQTCSPYRPGGPQSGPYVPPSSIPPSQPSHHSQQYPHYGQQPGNRHTPPPRGQYTQRRYYDGLDRGRPY
ncbi:hypothetical protein HOY82DRAFT_562685 [Tuber indicum]|nr:hypothetical protein HOY82DRAFT_562685 [Tuber indicum]